MRSPLFEQLADTIVHSLFEVNHCEWGKELLNDIFEEANRDIIRSIPIPNGDHEDKLIWSADENGTYIVKSGYMKLHGEFVNHLNFECYVTSKMMWR